MTDDDGSPPSEPDDAPDTPSDSSTDPAEPHTVAEPSEGATNGGREAAANDPDPQATADDPPGHEQGHVESKTVDPPVSPRLDGGNQSPQSVREWIHWFRTVESGPVMIVRELLSSVMLVLAVGLFLFAVSGVWPPMVAVQSGSMNPHMYKGDLVFIVDEHRFAPGEKAIDGTGVVPFAQAGEDGYTKFGARGDVIVYKPDGSTAGDPIIHRAHFWVEKDENWYEKADKSHVTADSCTELTYCPAPNAGFITKGDNPSTNTEYDQAQAMSRPVKPEWIKGKAMIRVPGLGWIRLQFGSLAAAGRGVAGVAGIGLFVGRRRLAA